VIDKTHRVKVARHDGSDVARTNDVVAAEDPLEIRLGDTSIAVVMRTPGDDADLVTGFLLTEGILLAPDELDSIEHLDDSRVRAHLTPDVEIDPERFRRNMFVSSSCGVCGKASIEAVLLVARPAPEFSVTPAVLTDLTQALRTRQPTFDETGGLHAAGLFNLEGKALAVREDVGRHNAVDKAIGATAKRSWPLPPSVLVVSGRQSFEIVQKAAVAGIGAIVGVSAPSSLAVELAGSLGMLLVGFARGDAFNVYAGSARLNV
jgi:FdhD protein